MGNRLLWVFQLYRLKCNQLPSKLKSIKVFLYCVKKLSSMKWDTRYLRDTYKLPSMKYKSQSEHYSNILTSTHMNTIIMLCHYRLHMEIGVPGLAGQTPWTGTLSRHKVVLLPGRDTMLCKWVLGLFAKYPGGTDRCFQGLKMCFTTFGVISKYYHTYSEWCTNWSPKPFWRFLEHLRRWIYWCFFVLLLSKPLSKRVWMEWICYL